MPAIWMPYRILAAINTVVLRIGRQLGWIALAFMVLAILYQVVMRYGFNAAPNWTEEAARFLMLWMTGLMAPSALRWGGFVAIDLVPRALPGRLGSLLALALLALCLMVLIFGVQLGQKHVTGGCLFNSSTLYVPFTLEINWLSPCKTDAFSWGGFEWNRVKLAWMYLSLWIGIILMTVVTVELILRTLIEFLDPGADMPEDPDLIQAGAD